MPGMLCIIRLLEKMEAFFGHLIFQNLNYRISAEDLKMYREREKTKKGEEGRGRRRGRMRGGKRERGRAPGRLVGRKGSEAGRGEGEESESESAPGSGEGQENEREAATERDVERRGTGESAW